MLVTPPVEFMVFLSVTPFLITSKPGYSDASSVPIVNDTLLIICITSSFTTLLIIERDVPVLSLTLALWNCVTVSPTPCGPTSTKDVPLYAYNCSLAVSHQKSPSDKPAGVVGLTSAPPVVRHFDPS